MKNLQSYRVMTSQTNESSIHPPVWCMLTLKAKR